MLCAIEEVSVQPRVMPTAERLPRQRCTEAPGLRPQGKPIQLIIEEEPRFFPFDVEAWVASEHPPPAAELEEEVAAVLLQIDEQRRLAASAVEADDAAGELESHEAIKALSSQKQKLESMLGASGKRMAKAVSGAMVEVRHCLTPRMQLLILPVERKLPTPSFNRPAIVCLRLSGQHRRVFTAALCPTDQVPAAICQMIDENLPQAVTYRRRDFEQGERDPRSPHEDLNSVS